MKILHLTKKYYPMLGGDAYVVFNLKKQQMELGHSVYVLTSNCDEIGQEEGTFRFGLKDTAANLDKITFKRLFSLVLLFFTGFGKLGTLKPDLIHCHSVDLGFFISFAARLYGIPVLNTCHGVSFDDKQYFFGKRAAEMFFLKHSGFKKIIAVDRKGLESLQNARILNGVLIPNGVDVRKFERKASEKIPELAPEKTPGKTPELAPEKAGNKTRFLFVGRLEKQKGVEYLIKAAGILAASIKESKVLQENKALRKNSLFEIIIVGIGTEEKALKIAAEEAGVGDLIKFRGKLGEEALLEEYLKCDIFVLPSLWEGLPLTLLEAAAVKLPIITTCVGGIPSVFTSGENALLIKPKDPAELAKAMQELMKDKKLRDKLGENARVLAEQYSWENSAKKLDEIYKECTGKG